MNQKVLKTLEYNKIIHQLTGYAASAPGKLLCQNLLPMSDFHEIVQAQTETSDALTRVRMKGSLSLSGIRDVRDSLKRLEIGSALGIPELLSISSLLTVAARAKAYGHHEESEEFPDDSLDQMFRSLEPLTPANNEIKRCIISEEEISDNASPGLHKVRRSMHGINDRIHTQLNSILNSCRSYLQDAVITMRDGRYCLPVKAEYKSQVNGMVHDQSSTGSTIFIEPISLKTVGLFTLMGQAGLHIPAFEGSELAVFEEVFADIGDEQSIEQSLSTFSAHMTNIVNILNQADSRSLCLFDELCSGTDPTEGAALAIAILNFLHNMKCRTMATTHYSELKIYALSTPGVENACCEFDVATLRPTYRLLIGIPGKSNAFAISKKLGLPDYIIEDAKNHLESEDETFEDVISRLEENRVTIEKERAEIESYKAEIAHLKSGLEKKEERFDERRDKMIRKANEEAQQILREAKETADRTIKNINKLAASSGIDTKALEAERTKLRDSLKKVEGGLSLKQETRKPHKAINPKTLKLGDGVRVLSMNLNGTVSSLPDAQGNVFVQMGILRSKVNISDLELLQENSVSGPGLEARRKGSGSSNIKMSKSFGISPEINVLGMTVDEAVAQLDKYLDDAYIAHLPQVRIVHGKGTGALRAGIHKHLKRLKYIKEFHLGGFGEGDAGVTIVVFK